MQYECSDNFIEEVEADVENERLAVKTIPLKTEPPAISANTAAGEDGTLPELRRYNAKEGAPFVRFVPSIQNSDSSQSTVVS